MKIKRLVFLLFLFHAIAIHAQVNLDSLLQIVQTETDQHKKSDAYINYLGKLSNTERDSAIDLLIAYEKTCEIDNFKYGLGRAKSLHGWQLMYKAQFEASLKMGHEALVYLSDIKDSFGIALTLNRIGIANLRFERFKDAESYLNKSYAYFFGLKDSAKLDMVLNNFGALYATQGMHDKAVSYYMQSLAIRLAQKKYYWVGYAYFNIGESYLTNGNIDSAKYYLLLAHQTFIEKTEDKKDPPMVSLGLGQCYFTLKDYEKALSYTLLGIEDAKKINQFELVVQGQEHLYKIYEKQGKYKEAFEAQKEFLVSKNIVDSTNNIAEVVEVESKYKTAEKEAEIAKLEAHNLDIENKVQRFRVYGLSAFVLVLLLSAVFILIYQRRNQQEKLYRADLTAKIAEAKMFALRAQMNPHFIFNCINTAQHFVIHNQKEQAYEYLADFAKLLRLVMENSSQTYVPLEDEIRQIELYANLESIRFEKKFTFEFEIDNELKNGVFEIPTMILQPLVENAIGHGLMNRKDANGKLIIRLKKQDDAILCEVQDNGIGQAKAQEIKSTKKLKYTSAAIPNIKERLSLIQNETGKNITLSLEDIDPNSTYPGTVARLLLPYQ